MELTKQKDYIEMDDVKELLINYWYTIENFVQFDDYNIELTNKERILAESIFYSKNNETHIKRYWVWAVDAIFNTIKAKYDKNNEVELIDFSIDALWRKTNAKAKVYMKLQIANKIYEEEAISPDIVKASIKAYLNWLNRILRDKKSLQN
jgi:nucleoid DNA-binding protein